MTLRLVAFTRWRTSRRLHCTHAEKSAILNWLMLKTGKIVFTKS